MKQLRKVKERQLKRSYQMKKLFSIIIANFVCWCGLILGSFHFFQQKKKPDLQISILENTHKFLVFLRNMKEKQLRRSYQMNMNHYLYAKDYDLSTCGFSVNRHIFINRYIFGQQKPFRSINTFSFNRHLLVFVYILQFILYISIYTTQTKLETQHYILYLFPQKTNK